MKTQKNCILIDDDLDDQLVFQTVIDLHFKTYELFAYSSFEKSKSFILNNSANIEAIFIDLNMPKSNGIDCLQFLRSHPQFKDKSIIIYSTSNNPDDVKKCLENGATDFISKPSRVKELVEVLGKHLD